MIDKKENSRYKETEIERSSSACKEEPKRFICPVCGKSLGDQNLPDIEGVIEEQVYYVKTFQIITSRVTLVYTFDHYYDEEEDMPMEEPHSVTSVIDTVFDRSGRCTSFDILEVYCTE